MLHLTAELSQTGFTACQGKTLNTAGLCLFSFPVFMLVHQQFLVTFAELVCKFLVFSEQN